MIIVSDNNLPLEIKSVMLNAAIRITSVFNPFISQCTLSPPLENVKTVRFSDVFMG